MANSDGVGPNRPTDDIVAMEDVNAVEGRTDGKSIRRQKFRGRRAVWPGAVGLLLVLLGGAAGITYYAIKLRDDVLATIPSEDAINQRYGSGQRIVDGRPVDVEQPIDVTNPESYKDMKCELPNYESKNNKIYATFKSGKSVPLAIKGVSWLGMETRKHCIKGLWDSTRDGSTLYRIGEFLAGNKFNSVRIPLAIDAVFRNLEPDPSINTNSNRAIDPTRYLRLIKSIVEGLQQFKISVLLDFHVRTYADDPDPDKRGDIPWEDTSVRVNDIKDAITALAKDLCNARHWNVIGVDLKDSPDGATWGDDSPTDWKATATVLGNHLLKACPSWLVFVQGIKTKETSDKSKEPIKYMTWSGGNLIPAVDDPIELTAPNKLVYAPQFYSPSNGPKIYFYKDGKVSGNLVMDAVEFPGDADLKTAVAGEMDKMFGGVLKKQDSAVVLSSFGGLYGKEDKHPKKTSKRAIDAIISKMTVADKGLAGGYWWSLNPDTLWRYVSADNSNTSVSGLVDDTWRAANMEVLTGLEQMNDMPNLGFFPCNG